MTEPKLNFSDNPREILRTGMNWILHPPADLGLPDAIKKAIDDNCDAVEMLTRNTNDAHEQAWRRAALATKLILRDYADTVKNEWLAAYARPTADEMTWGK